MPKIDIDGLRKAAADAFEASAQAVARLEEALATIGEDLEPQAEADPAPAPAAEGAPAEPEAEADKAS